MKDPTRIPVVLEALRTAWEGRPDLELASLWEILRNEGVAFGTSDEELLTHLRRMAQKFPPLIDDTALHGHFAVIDTTSPRRRVTLDCVEHRVTVRGFDDTLRPATWTGGEIVRLRTGMPAVLRDHDGTDHRLGVVESMRLYERPLTIRLDGRHRRDMGDEVYGVITHTEDTVSLVIISHRLEVLRAQRRHIDTETYKFEEIVACAAGKALKIRRHPGRAAADLGVVEDVFPLEA